MKTPLPNCVFLTTTCMERTNMLFATLSSVMNAVEGALFVIQHYGPWPKDKEDALHTLAYVTKNRLSLLKLDESVSVARSKFATKLPDHMEWFINLDDDLIVPSHAWGYLEMAGNLTDVVTFGVVDANNSRGPYPDYTREVFADLDAYIAKGYQLEKAKHHFFAYPFILPGQWLTQLYAMKANLFHHRDLWDPILVTFDKRGVRGYDVMLEKRLTDFGLDITLVAGCEAHHIGVEHSFIGGNWTDDHYAK